MTNLPGFTEVGMTTPGRVGEFVRLASIIFMVLRVKILGLHFILISCEISRWLLLIACFEVDVMDLLEYARTIYHWASNCGYESGRFFSSAHFATILKSISLSS
jgi:hypothetical protein